MGDGLTVSGGGTIRVSTGELGSAAAKLRELAGVAGSCVLQLDAIDLMVDPARLAAVDAPISSMKAEQSLDTARELVSRVKVQASAIVLALDTAADVYGVAEASNERAARKLAADLAYGLGVVAPGLFAMSLPFLGAGFGAGFGLWALTPKERRGEIIDWFRENKEWLSDPAVIDAIRLSAMSVDEFGAGMMLLPKPLVDIFGSETLGALGYTASAATLTGTARAFGLLKETDVVVARETTRNTAKPATTFAELARRIPTNGAQIRFDRYVIPGEPDRFVAYLGGTKDGSLLTGKEPWDTTSNLTALTLGDAGSMKATREAMVAAGVTASTPVQFIGYSQGALMAVRLANSGDYLTAGIFTVGGPVGQLSAPDVPFVALEHREDIVPASGGEHIDNDTIVVRREVFAGKATPSGSLFPAHDISLYRETAAMLDETHESRITGAAESFAEFSAGATQVQSSTWRARRTAGEPTEG